MQGSTDRRFGTIFNGDEGIDGPSIWLKFSKWKVGIHGRPNRSKFLEGMQESQTADLVEISKWGWRDSRTVDLGQIFDGESRDPRTAESLRFLKRGYVSYDLTVLTSNRTEPNQLRTGGTIIHV